MRVQIRLVIIVFFLVTGTLFARPLKFVKPEKVGMDSRHLALVNGVIDSAIARHEIPGAVLLVLRQGNIVFRRAYGNCQLIPQPREMTESMIFDLASITKPVATTSCIMKLVELGKIRLWDRVEDYIPTFASYVDSSTGDSASVRIWHLLTHTSGLQPYTNADSVSARFGDPCPTDSLVTYIAQLPRLNAPGAEFHYSCLGFITLAHIVKQVSGYNVDEFSQQYIFRPLGMRDTGYLPPASKRNRCVPTEVIDGKPLIGVVHDPLARLQGGISGNAGLFSTADDLAIFASMMLQKGVFKGKRIFSPLTVERMTEIYVRVVFAGRGLGWDLDSDYSTNGGDLFGPHSFGHSGYTGTSIWLDPETRTAVIFLTNRVHPDDSGSVVPLRSKVANIVASAIVTL